MTTALTRQQSSTTLTPLGEAVAEYIAAAQAPATVRAYASDWRDFAEWCDSHDVSPMPASADTVAGYIADLARSGAKTATIERRISALSVKHKRANQPNPCRAELVREALAGIKRKHGTAATKKQPMRLDDLRAFCHCQTDDLAGVRNRAMLALLFAGALRRAELVALDRADLRISAREMTVTLRRRKTDQDGKGTTIRIQAVDGSDVCPVAAMTRWIAMASIDAGPLFRPIYKDKPIERRLTAQVVAAIVKAAARACGLDARDFGGHSGRSGFVTEAFEAGVAEAEIMEVTGHRSQAMMRGYRRVTGTEQTRAIARVFGAR